jgi:DNA sulfur modification protein DndC
MTVSVGFAEITTAVLIEQIVADIKEQYLADATPWIIGFSGGKDSTTLFRM